MSKDFDALYDLAKELAARLPDDAALCMVIFADASADGHQPVIFACGTRDPGAAINVDVLAAAHDVICDAIHNPESTLTGHIVGPRPQKQ